MANSKNTSIILLKNKSSPADNYEEIFLKEGYRPAFVPVLDHVFNEQGLDSIRTDLLNGAFRGDQDASPKQYGGLVVTSQRAVEAFSHIVQESRQKGVNVDTQITPDLPIYVVGPATAKSLRSLNLPFNILGEHTGNGDVLADFIVNDYNRRHDDSKLEENNKGNASSGKPPLLFLVGEQRRDIIPRTLQSESLPDERRIKVDEVTVYETAVKDSFEADFQSQIEPSVKANSTLWVVVFSPTGCRVMLEGLGLLDPQSGTSNKEAKSQMRNTFIATIGPTTQKYLIREFDFEPDVCSSAPSPEGLLQSIVTFEKQQIG